MTQIIKLNEVVYSENALTFSEYIELTRQSKTLNIFSFLLKFIEKTTTLSTTQIKGLLLSDAIACAVTWSVSNFPELPISEDGNLFMSDLINRGDNPYGEECRITVEGYLFDIYNLTLDVAINCENLCYAKGKPSLLNVYLIAGTCDKGASYGVKALLESDISTSLMSDIRQLADSISKVGHTSCVLSTEHESLSLRVQTSTDSVVPVDNGFFFTFLSHDDCISLYLAHDIDIANMHPYDVLSIANKRVENANQKDTDTK